MNTLATVSRRRLLLNRRLGSVLAAFVALALFCFSPSNIPAEEVLVAHPALTFGDIPYYIAREKGFYREEDFQVKDIYIRGGVTASQALQAGSVVAINHDGFDRHPG